MVIKLGHVLAVAVLVPLLAVMGCATTSSSTTTPPSSTTSGPNQAINDGTSMAVSFGLPLAAAATDPATVTADAKLALVSVNGVLALLNPTTGTTTATTANLQALLTQIVKGDLSTTFSGSPIVGGIIELALPLLIKNIPTGLTDASGAVISVIPPTPLAYLVAFFQGAQTGLNNYLTGKSAKDISSAIVAGNATLDLATFKTQLLAKVATIKAKQATTPVQSPVPVTPKGIAPTK